MPRRIARSHTGPLQKSSGKKTKRPNPQRHLDAFSIAGEQEAEKFKFRRHRLGEVEDENDHKAKRRRLTEQNEDDEGESAPRAGSQTQTHDRHLNGDSDSSGGSDSEGNEWRIDSMAPEDDEEIDSDEAFGESDEERFADFVFRGSSSNKKRNATTRGETNPGNVDSEDDDESLGSDAVDLVAMLDDENGDEDAGIERTPKAVNGVKLSQRSNGDGIEHLSDESDWFEDGSEGDGDSDTSLDSQEPEERPDPKAAEKLRKAVSALPKLPTDGETTEPEARHERPGMEDILASLKKSSKLNPMFTKSLKKMTKDLEDSRKPSSGSDLVKVPLPKRQQDKVDRTVAYEKSKEALNRWLDTVKHNRRADHLSFPLNDPHAQEPRGTSKMLPPTRTDAIDDISKLDAAIDDILQQSGLGSSADMDKQVQAAEELETKNIPFEEVLARRAEIRKRRDLMFREEKRAKRIKKIKSKAFRRVHRKERERAAQSEYDTLLAAGLVDEDAEQEKHARQRAEARVGGRHRESRWAKGLRESDRMGWDDEAREGMLERARKDEELRKRIEGRANVTGDNDESESEEESESDDDDDDDDEAVQAGLMRRLNNVQSNGTNDELPTGLGALKFMQRAEAARKQRNDEALEDLRRTIADDADEDSGQEEETEVSGRRSFGPQSAQSRQPPQRGPVRGELEEQDHSDPEDDDAGLLPEPQQESIGLAEATETRKQPPVNRKETSGTNEPAMKRDIAAIKDTGRITRTKDHVNKNDNTQTKPVQQPIVNSTIPDNRLTKVSVPAHEEESEGEADKLTAHPEQWLMPSNEELVRQAFGGDDVEDEFAREKQALAESEEEKVDDQDTVPGWGSWVGAGVRPRKQPRGAETQRQKKKPGKSSKVGTAEGVAKTARRDTAQARVIISERRQRRSAKYLAPVLPHPFETREQYERSLRLPIGPEWTTKEVHQKATKPRILVKQGIIRPMETPLL